MTPLFYLRKIFCALLRNKVWFFGGAAFFISILLSITPALAVNISLPIPGMSGLSPTSTPPGQWVSKIYNFALMIGGVLAFGAVVYGGILYAASGGNPSKQSEGREWITSALLGILLLGGAYLILYTVNPDLVNLNLPSLQGVNIQAPQTPTPGGCDPNTSFSCGSLCCISGFQSCQHLGGVATACVIQSACPVSCGQSLCCAGSQHCIQQQASPTSPVQYSCL